jgi:glycine/D-amino acid oxidase-like deaminating enzyme
LSKPTFWAFEELAAHRTLDRDLTVDALVIGGGMTGLTSAYLLAEAGVTVALVERQRIASGDTGHTTAHLTAVTDIRPHELVRLVGDRDAAALWAAHQAALGQIQHIADALGPVELTRVPGFLHVPFDADDRVEHERRVLSRDAELAARWGVDSTVEERVPLMNQPGIRFNQAERTWDCPCHGSRFSGDGDVLRGPAERGLEPLNEPE